MTSRSIVVFFTLLLIFFIAGAASAGSLSKADAGKILQEGNYMFMKANELSRQDPWQAKDLYSKAASHFESIVAEGGIKNGKLYYNIGNAYFMSGDIGRAILWYKRSFTFMPNDVNLVSNLAYAKSKRIDKIEEKETDKISRIVFFWYYDIPQGVRLVLFISFFLIIWILLSLKLFIKNSFFNWGAIVSIVFSLVFFGTLVADAISASTQKPGVIVENEVTARKGDGETYEPSFQEPLHAGTEFNLVESRRGWDHIELADGRNCWIPEKTAGLVK